MTNNMHETTTAKSGHHYPSIPEWGYALLLAAFSMIYHAVVGVQGFDMYDEGWSLTGFQQIFEAPDSVEYLFLYYLTNIVGGLWNEVFGWGGIYAFRLLAGIVLTLTAVVVWQTLKPYFNRWLIFLGIAASYLCSYYGMMVFYHNYLTALLAVCAAYALLKALTKDSWRWMMVSGFIIGCNVFVRLPNITLTALILLLIPYYCHHRDLRKTLGLLGTGVGGFVIGGLAVILLMLLLGHLDIFMTAIDNGVSATSDTQSTHNLSSMVSTYLSVYATVFTLGFFNNTYTIYLTGTLISLWVIFSRRYEAAYVYLACVVLLLMHLLPLGSDYGIENMGENCVHLAAPFVTGWVGMQISRLSSKRLKMMLGVTALLCAAVFMLRGGKNIMQQCYFDEGSRLEKTYRPEVPLATTFTTARNSQELNIIYQKLTHYVKPGDELLCFQNMPMLHFLTQTRPYLKNPWVWSYDPSNMELHFREAAESGRPLPVIVREKSMIPYWTEPYPDWDNPHAEDSYLHKNKKILLIQQFIEQHHYQVAWEDGLCQILIVP